jgi:AraC-like DNA-binding protein/quercetin dioxygenase-like cupin family protein
MHCILNNGGIFMSETGDIRNKYIRSYLDTEKFPLSTQQVYPQVDTPWHQHDFIELCIASSGRGLHQTDHEEKIIRRGDVYVIPRGMFHQYSQCSEDFDIINILYVPELIPMPLLDATYIPGYEKFYLCKNLQPGEFPFMHLEEKEISTVIETAAELIRESHSSRPGHIFNSLGIFMHLQGRLLKHFSADAAQKENYYLSTADAVSYLNSHYEQKVSIAKLCAIAGMSKAALMQNFARSTGTTPLQYQLNLRIAEAVILLRSTNKSISEIAMETGFSDTNYFGRQFKRITGSSPGEYRKKCRNTGKE